MFTVHELKYTKGEKADFVLPVFPGFRSDSQDLWNFVCTPNLFYFYFLDLNFFRRYV